MNASKKIEKNFGEKRRSNSKNLASLSPSQMLAGLTLGFVGFIFAFMPFKGDMDFKTAMNTGNLLKVIESVKKPYASAFHAEIALDAKRSNLLPLQVGRTIRNQADEHLRLKIF